MYLFTRRARLTHAAGLQWAVAITEHVRRASDHDVQLWGTTYSPGYGTVSWTAWFEDLPHLESFGDKLATDEAYQTMAAEGSSFTEGGVDDGLLQLLTAPPDPDREINYVTGVQAVCAGGNARRAMELGMAIAEQAGTITGVPTMFVRSLSGPYGGVGWLTGHADIADMERANDALAADDAWLDLVDTTDGAFVEDPAITTQTIYRKLA